MARVFVNGLSFYFEEIGVGEPVVFLSGLGGDHRAFAVPMRSFGRSIGPWHWTTETSAVATAMRTITRPRTSPTTPRAGSGTRNRPCPRHRPSIGGLIAKEVALRHPERVRTLTFVSTHAGSSLWKKAVVSCGSI